MNANQEERSALGELFKLRDKLAAEKLDMDAIREDVRKNELRQLMGNITIDDIQGASVADDINTYQEYDNNGVTEGIPAGLRTDPMLDGVGDYYNQKSNQILYDSHQMQKDERGPLRQYMDHILDDKPFYEGQDDPTSLGADLALAPIRGLKYAADKGYEGYKEDKPYQMAGAAALAGLMGTPVLGKGLGKIGSKFLTKTPQAVKDGVAITAPPVALGTAMASTDGVIDDALADDTAYKMSDYTRQTIERMNSQKQKLLNEIKTLEDDKAPESKAGAAGKDIKAIQRKLGFSDKAIDGAWGSTTTKGALSYNNKINLKIENLKEQLGEFSDDKISAFVEGERKKHFSEEAEKTAKDRQTSSRELYPNMPYIAGTLGYIAASAFPYLRGKSIAGKFNKETADISKRWKQSIDKGKNPRDLLANDFAVKSSKHYGGMMDDAVKKYEPSGFFQEASKQLPAAAMVELGLSAPDIMDSMRGIPGKDIGLDTLGRLITGGITGIGVGKIGYDQGFKNRNHVQRYDAESKALGTIGGHKGGSQGYYKGKIKEGLEPVEHSLDKRLQSQKERLQIQKLNDLKRKAEQEHLSTPKGRKALIENQSPQGKQNQRQGNQDESSLKALDNSSELAKNQLHYHTKRAAYNKAKLRKNASPATVEKLRKEMKSALMALRNKEKGKLKKGYIGDFDSKNGGNNTPGKK